MQRQRAILIENVTYFNVMFLRILRFKIYYLKNCGEVSNKFLKLLCATALSYEHVNDNNAYSLFKIREELVEELYQSCSKSDKIFTALKKSWSQSKGELAYFRFLVRDGVYNDAFSAAELVFLARNFPLKARIFFWSTNYCLKPVASEFKNLFPSIIAWINLPISIVGLLVRTFIRRAVLVTQRKTGQESALLRENLRGRKLSDFRIIFFPHQGIYYGDLFLKDHFYSKNKGLNPSDILHLFQGDSPEIVEKTVCYYDEHGIPFADFNTLQMRSPLELMKLVLKRIKFHHILSSFFSSRYWCTGPMIISYLKVVSKLSALERIPNAKYAMYGYEVLAPISLSIALHLKGIETIATQERFLNAFQKFNSIIVDHYFVQGKVVADHIKNESGNYHLVKNIYPVGPVRSDLILDGTNVYDEKYYKIKNDFFLILVLDYHPAENAEQNRRQCHTNWKLNKKFYYDIIQIARSNPQGYFVIKGKNTNVLYHSEFTEIVNAIDAVDNISFERDLKKYSPYLMASLVDGCIAMHTSLGDEMLSRKIPVIFYDLIGVPGKFFDYSPLAIIANDYETLNQLTCSMIRGDMIDEDDFEYISKEFYSINYDGERVKEKISERISQIVG